MTLRELVFMVLDECKIHSDDSYFNEDHVSFLLSKYRSFLLKKELEKENKSLNKVIDKFKNNLKKFLKWLCHKFSYPCEDDLIRDFNKETYSNINFEKQLDINHFQKEDNEIDYDI